MSAIYNPDSYEPRGSVGYLVNRIRTEILDAMDRELAPFDVTGAQYVILSQIYFGMADSSSGLCRGISYDPGAMTRMIDRLEAKGLLRRVRNAEDRRSVNLEMTAEGMQAFPRMKEVSVAVQNRFLRGFSAGEARQLEDFLKRVLNNA
jgi:DNA-binding MarR family transcriptional regulator